MDFLFRDQRTIVEFDGLAKFRTPEDLRAEKLGEDRLRSLGFEVVRLTWADLARPVERTSASRAHIGACVGPQLPGFGSQGWCGYPGAYQ